PWGVVEAKLLLCQIALGRGHIEAARTLLAEIHRAGVKEPEPKQHSLLTEAWLAAEAGDAESAEAAIDAAASVFNDQSRVGDHTPHLLGRLSRFHFPPDIQTRIESWRSLVNDKGRREQA
ncbi:MAG TPA: hypothetical protein VHE30_23210, partial [Polyangiaceae bacterium]|nr:hypothetical protein [Polyangiaceae bacterium]